MKHHKVTRSYRLSIVMIVKNEAKNLAISLPALQGLADEIIVLDSGRIVQEGTHNQLVNQEGFYKDLYTKQLSEKENA